MPETPTLNRRVVLHLSVAHFVPTVNPDGQNAFLVRTARRGQFVDLTESEERRLDELDALLPPGSKPEDAEREQAARLDAYRGERGDVEALERHLQRANVAPVGGVVNVDAPDVSDSSVDLLAAWIRDKKPSADDTVALAEGDKDRARKVLEAETVATGGSPRAEVAEPLGQLINS